MRSGIVLSAILLIISGCEGNSPKMPVGLMTSRSAQEAGARIYAAKCAICHGPTGNGEGLRRAFISPPPVNLTLPPWSAKENALRTYRIVRTGVPGTAMPSWSTLSDQQIWEVIAYIHTLRQL